MQGTARWPVISWPTVHHRVFAARPCPITTCAWIRQLLLLHKPLNGLRHPRHTGLASYVAAAWWNCQRFPAGRQSRQKGIRPPPALDLLFSFSSPTHHTLFKSNYRLSRRHCFTQTHPPLPTNLRISARCSFAQRLHSVTNFTNQKPQNHQNAVLHALHSRRRRCRCRCSEHLHSDLDDYLHRDHHPVP